MSLNISPFSPGVPSSEELQERLQRLQVLIAQGMRPANAASQTSTQRAQTRFEPTQVQRAVQNAMNNAMQQQGAIQTYDSVPASEPKPYRAQLTAQSPKQGLIQTADMRNDIVGNWGAAAIQAVANAEELFYGPGNSNFSLGQIKEGVKDLVDNVNRNFAQYSEAFRATEATRAVIQAALHYDVSVDQITDAMAGEVGYSRARIEQYLRAEGMMSPGLWQSVVDASVASAVRARLNGTGIDGRGVIVRVQEPSNTTHTDLVSLVLNDAQLGIAPGATIEKGFMSAPAAGATLSPQDAVLSELAQIQPMAVPQPEVYVWRDALKNVLTNSAVATMNQQTATVNDIVDHSAARVVNMSYGTDLTMFCQLAAQVMDELPELKQAVLGGTPHSDDVVTDPLCQPVVLLAYSAVYHDPLVQEALARYVAATRRAAESGKVLVVAAGNSQRLVNDARNLGVALPPDAAFNMFGLSDYVISVGASSTQGTPAQVNDDTMADFSSLGRTDYHPTVVTQGVQIPVNYPTYLAWLAQSLSNTKSQGISGTSFSAPIVAGAVALMLQQNPFLSFAQVKAAVQAAAVDTDALPSAEGAGMFDVVKAVLGDAAGNAAVA